MKRLIFTILVVMTAGLVTSAYSQVSIHASFNLGRTGIYIKSTPVAYEPAYVPVPPACNDNGYNRERVAVVIGNPGCERNYGERSEVRYDNDRSYRNRNYRNRDYRDRDDRERDGRNGNRSSDHRSRW